MNELPITTTFFLPSPSAERIFWTLFTCLSVKILYSSLNPGRGSDLGIPPVASTSFVYGMFFPDFVDTDFSCRFTDATSSVRFVMPASANHCSERSSIFDASGIRALESLVRSIGRDSLEMTVMLPEYLRVVRVWMSEIVPEPLLLIFGLVVLFLFYSWRVDGTGKTNPPITTTFSSFEVEHFPTGTRRPVLISFSVPRM